MVQIDLFLFFSLFFSIKGNFVISHQSARHLSRARGSCVVTFCRTSEYCQAAAWRTQAAASDRADRIRVLLGIITTIEMGLSLDISMDELET